MSARPPAANPTAQDASGRLTTPPWWRLAFAMATLFLGGLWVAGALFGVAYALVNLGGGERGAAALLALLALPGGVAVRWAWRWSTRRFPSAGDRRLSVVVTGVACYMAGATMLSFGVGMLIAGAVSASQAQVGGALAVSFLGLVAGYGGTACFFERSGWRPEEAKAELLLSGTVQRLVIRPTAPPWTAFSLLLAGAVAIVVRVWLDGSPGSTWGPFAGAAGVLVVSFFARRAFRLELDATAIRYRRPWGGDVEFVYSDLYARARRRETYGSLRHVHLTLQAGDRRVDLPEVLWHRFDLGAVTRILEARGRHVVLRP